MNFATSERSQGVKLHRRALANCWGCIVDCPKFIVALFTPRFVTISGFWEVWKPFRTISFPFQLVIYGKSKDEIGSIQILSALNTRRKESNVIHEFESELISDYSIHKLQ